MEVLFRAPIVRTPGWEFKTGQQSERVGAADVIDLNNSGSAETFESLPDADRPDFQGYKSMLHDHLFRDRGHVKDGGFYQYRYNEPVLSTSLENLAEIAKTSGGLVDEKSYPGMHVQAGGVNWQGARLFEPEVYGRERSTCNALPAQSNAVSIHEGFDLVASPQTSMQALVHKLVPTHPQASWHINPETREFLITT